jgi:uncharacterized protein
MTVRSERPELIRLEVDRRLGHEWDEWDGAPLPDAGNFDSPIGLFFVWSVAWVAAVAAVAALTVYLLGPRLAELTPSLPSILMTIVGAFAALSLLWLAITGLSLAAGKPLLPERLLERGPLLVLMRQVSALSGRLGWRDRVENAAVKVYDSLALARSRKVGGQELLLLIPRCLSKDTLEGVLTVAKRYEVPVFVATRGQLARRVIRERRPRAVVAVACERDMVSGLADVADKVPVLGLTLTLPEGPCKDTRVDLDKLDEFMRAYLV